MMPEPDLAWPAVIALSRAFIDPDQDLLAGMLAGLGDDPRVLRSLLLAALALATAAMTDEALRNGAAPGDEVTAFCAGQLQRFALCQTAQTAGAR